ncbi:unnamed protein product [Closterium sp. NIES-54]
MGHFIPTNATATAEATARLFFDRIITIHGIPATLISDRDPKFTTCKDDVSHWDTQLPTLEFAYNNASHAATGKTPFFLCYGREPLTPQQPTTPAHVQAAHDFVTTVQQLWEKTQRRLTTMQNSQKQYVDRQRRDHSVAVGDQILTKQLRPARALDVITKLSAPGVVKAGKAAALGVKPPACPARMGTRANDIRAGLTTLTRPTLNQPLTGLLGRLSLALTLLLLAPTTTRASTLRSRPTTTSPTASTAATPSAASTATTRASTSATGPTTATTSTASASSTAAPTTTPTATSTTTAASSTTPSTLALAVAALRTSRSSTDVLTNSDVCSSSRG